MGRATSERLLYPKDEDEWCAASTGTPEDPGDITIPPPGKFTGAAAAPVRGDWWCEDCIVDETVLRVKHSRQHAKMVSEPALG